MDAWLMRDDGCAATASFLVVKQRERRMYKGGGRIYSHFTHSRRVVGCSESEEKCLALGSEWRAMTEVDSPGSAVGLGRRFASCDLYPVYSSCPSSLPPGIPRDVCGYLTRENNLRKYIALTCPPMQPGDACERIPRTIESSRSVLP